MNRTAPGQTFLLPDLGEGLTEAEIVRWRVAVGDRIAVDEPILEVETAKAVVEVPSPYAGTVLALHAAEGETLDVGKPLITVGAGQAEPSHPEGERYREEERAGSGNVLIGYGTSGQGGSGRRRRPRKPAPTPSPAGGPVLVSSPLVRKLARDNGVDLARVTASGAGGVITRGDVDRAIARPSGKGVAVAARGERRTPLGGFRKAVAAALTRSRSEIPEATVWVDVDATALWALRDSARTPAGPGPGLMAYIARFVVAGLREYPVLNATIDTERAEIVEYDRIDLGIAVQGERGLMVPAVFDAGALTTYQLDQGIRDVTARARVGRCTPEELAAGTFTLNNYGGFRVDGSAAIIHHPQVAILGFGRIIDRPWVVDGEITVRKITQMSFVFDHRVCDGGTAAGFMRSVADAIENPASAIARM
jgi:pyruvate dehydrogenase E2 component (dihydrolipoamide acetyltransferase)